MGKLGKNKTARPKRSRQSNKCEPNPFEIRINRQHHSILGGKKKLDRGLPGISRNKAIKKREQTLLKEYQQLHKSNSFVDRRIGENDLNADPEEKAMARFAKEWKKSRKSNIYNLNDEDLTHFGQSLGEMNEFDVPRSDSEDEDGNLQGDFVKKAHFGGFMTEKNANLVQPDKSHKEIMQDLISETKKIRYERQAEKEANTDLTEKLDQDWKTLQTLLSKPKPHQKPEPQKADDDYDVIMNSFKLVARGKPTDRLKTEEELASESQKKLIQLESERQKRMAGTGGKLTPKVPHVSADSLDDGIQLDFEEVEDVSSDIENSEFENKTDKNIDEDGCIDVSADESSEGEDSYADIISDGSDSECDLSTEKKEPVKKNSISQVPKVALARVIPDTSEELEILFTNKSSEEKLKQLDHLIKLHHPSLREGNRGKLESLFSVLLNHIDDICSHPQTDLSIIDPLVPLLNNLLLISPAIMSKALLNVITEKRKTFCKSSKTIGKKVMPCLDTLIFLKLVSILYPTSDFRHPLVTSSLLFMSEVLVSSKIHSLQDMLNGLFICNLLLEYVSYSKRFIPEVIVFLKCLLPVSSSAANVKEKAILKVLRTTDNVVDIETLNLKWLVKGSEIQPSCSMKTNVIYCCIALLKMFAELYVELPSFQTVFQEVRQKCQHMDSQHFPEKLKSELNLLLDCLTKTVPLKHLSFQCKKPQSLKMYTPRIQERFDGKKQRPKMSAEKVEHQKLLQKYKKEFKGAVREIRRDNQFISRQQLNDQLQKDDDRKQKLKSLYQDLAQQEGDFKRYKKRKR